MNPFIQEIAANIAAHADLSAEEIAGQIAPPPSPEMGEYAFGCFTLAKTMRKSPAAIAQELAAKLEPGELIESVSDAGPYLNFKIKRDQLAAFVLAEVFDQGAQYGTSDEGAGKTVVIDYSSPNIAKPIGIHHLRTTAIGHALYRIYQALGYTCVGINHLGDWGTQFGTVIVAYKRWGKEELLKEAPIHYLLDLYVKFHQEAESNPSLADEARGWFVKLEDGDEEATRLWQLFRDLSLTELKGIYEQIGIRFDHYWGESFYNEMLDDTIASMAEKGLLRKSEGAQIVDLSEHDLPAYLIRKSDGASLYQTRDIAAALYRHEQFGFEKMIYVVGAQQNLHFQQLFKVLELMGCEWVGKCVHVNFGTMRFKEGRMSTREGKIVFLEEVFERAVALTQEIIEQKNPDLENKEEVAHAVGVGAVQFADLSTRRIKDITFDWDEVLNFDGETGPYVQYTHARFCSMVRKFGKSVDADVDFSLLTSDQELAVVRLLEAFPGTIRAAAESYEPSLIARYLIDLSAEANRFYHACRVLGEDAAVSQGRILIVSAVKTVLAKGLYLLGIQAPEEM
ncbi:MAG: arginine--tRNA ligase [Candidatus Latescibacterota bacterium]